MYIPRAARIITAQKQELKFDILYTVLNNGSIIFCSALLGIYPELNVSNRYESGNFPDTKSRNWC